MLHKQILYIGQNKDVSSNTIVNFNAFDVVILDKGSVLHLVAGAGLPDHKANILMKAGAQIIIESHDVYLGTVVGGSTVNHAPGPQPFSNSHLVISNGNIDDILPRQELSEAEVTSIGEVVDRPWWVACFE